jgi:hypothetical protein
MPTPGLRGRLPAKPSQLPFIHRYLLASAVPPAMNYPYDISCGLNAFPMYGNGADPSLTVNNCTPVHDCFWAARQDNRRVKAANYGIVEAGMTSNEVVTEYLAYNHGQDLGGCMVDVLHAWYLAGIITAYGRVDPANPAAIDSAAVLFHGTLLGVNLTDDADTLTSKGLTWTVANGEQPDPAQGHVLVKVGSDGFSYDEYITWTFLQRADPAWTKACVQEAWVIVSSEDASQLDMPALLADINAVGGTSLPIPKTSNGVAS